MIKEEKLICSIDYTAVYEMNDVESQWLKPLTPPSTVDDITPTISELVKELKVEVSRWFTIGMFLQVPEWKLSAIKADEHGDSMDCLVKMLVFWQKNAGRNNRFMWETVIEAVRHIDNKTLAEKLEKTHLNVV